MLALPEARTLDLDIIVYGSLEMRDDPLLSERSDAVLAHRYDLEALAAAPTRIVVLGHKMLPYMYM